MTGKKLILRFCRDEQGATAIEYGLIAALIAVALISTFAIMGNTMINLFGVGAGGSSDIIAEQATKIPGT